MPEKKPKKEKEPDSLDATLKTLITMVGGIEKRLAKIEGHEDTPPKPEIQPAPESKGLETLPYKAKEVLKREFPEAKIHEVKPHKGGYMIVLDLTDITGGRIVTATRPKEGGGSEPYETHERDYRNVPVKAMQVEKSIVDRVKVIKTNLGWIKKEQTPQQIEREIKPEERKLPPGVKNTPESEFFTTDVE